MTRMTFAQKLIAVVLTLFLNGVVFLFAGFLPSEPFLADVPDRTVDTGRQHVDGSPSFSHL